MSRDFTPAQLHLADAHLDGALSTSRMVWHIGDKTFDERDDKLLETYRNRYPNLFFLFDNARRMIPCSEALETVFIETEDTLKRYIELSDKNEALPNDVIAKWYQGKYAPFYYNTENNRMFEAFIKAQCYQDLYDKLNFFKGENGEIVSLEGVDKENGLCYLSNDKNETIMVSPEELLEDYECVSDEVYLKAVKERLDKGESLSHIASDLADGSGYDYGEVHEDNGIIIIKGCMDSSVGFYSEATILECPKEDLLPDKLISHENISHDDYVK